MKVLSQEPTANRISNSNGEITTDEFKAAGDYLVERFPTWSWSPRKEYLVTRNVPCHKRNAELRDAVTVDETAEESGIGGEEAWLNTTGASLSHARNKGDVGQVHTLDGNGNVGEETLEGEDGIPDLEDDDDDPEALIRNPKSKAGTTESTIIKPTRTYDLYIAYSGVYYTPQMFLSGYSAPGQPLTFDEMKEDFMSDYTNKTPTVSMEYFKHSDSSMPVMMATAHACQHAKVMKLLLDKRDAAVRLRREKEQAKAKNVDVESITAGTDELNIKNTDAGHKAGVAAAGGAADDEWDVLSDDDHGKGDEDGSIRADQYLVVFLKYIASIMPSVEWDSTMAI